MSSKQIGASSKQARNKQAKQEPSSSTNAQLDAKNAKSNNNSVVNAQARFTLFAMLAGFFGAMSGVAGKLSVSSEITLEFYVRIATFAMNAVCTGQMWRYYLKALSLGPTPTCQILNTGTNFVVSAALGLFVFGEEVNAMWCAGAVMVVAGLGVIVSDPGIPKMD